MNGKITEATEWCAIMKNTVSMFIGRKTTELLTFWY
jgi:hypothetical protein